MKKLILARSISYASIFGLSAMTGVSTASELDFVLEEITVTSQMRAQSLQEVPVAVTAFSASDILEAGISSSQDFIDLTPNVSLDDSFTYGNTFISIRGVSQINNADSPVAIVVDGVPQNNQKQFKMKMFDIERIEVLKGPQGSLYGRNAIGGAISIVSKKPSEELEGFFDATLGNGALLDISGGVSNTLIDDKLAFRLAGSYLERDGLIDNTFLNTEADFVDEDYSVRGNLMFTPSDTLSVDFRFSTSKFDAGSSYDVTTNSVLNPTYRSGDANGFFDPDENNLGRTIGEVDELTVKIDWDLDFATLTSITGYTDLSEVYTADLDFSNPTGLGGFLGVLGQVRQAQNLDVDMLSQEIRLVSPGHENFRWIAGVFYIETNRQLETIAGCDDDPGCALTVDFLAGVPFGTLPADVEIINRAEDNDNTAWSVFGQMEFDLTDSLTAQLGLRYDSDEREQTDVIGGVVLDDKYDAWQPKVTLNYQFDEDVLGYATYSTGFRSGGFNAPGLGLPQFQDEFLQNFELGLKSELMDGRLVINSALFYSNSDDYQFFFIDAATAAQFIGNLEEVDILGFDADLRFLATESIEIFGGIGLTDTEIKTVGGTTTVALDAGGVDTSLIKGSHAPKNTPVTFNFGLQHTVDFNDEIVLRTRVDYEYRGKKYWQVDNLDIQRQLDLLGVRMAFEAESWSVTLWGRNLLNEEYYSDFNPAEFSGSQTDIGFPAQPRTYGLDLSFNF